jgi:hypothetical protein
MTVTADDLTAATVHVVKVLGTAADQDWSAAVGTGDLDAGATAEHLADTLMAYGAQLVARPPGRYVKFDAHATTDATPVDLLEFVVASAGLLAAAVRGATSTVRAWHPWGMADPAGFAGMGCVEVLVHGSDIATGLGLTLNPPRALCRRVVARMFPDVTGVEDDWAALLWATNRISLPDRESRDGWRWHGAPLDG